MSDVRPPSARWASSKQEGTSADPSLRVLCLGNELLADDAFGKAVAEQASPVLPKTVEVVFSSMSGLNLLEDILGVSRLLVVDTVQTGTAPHGTRFLLREGDILSVPGGSPHFIGLFETLKLARELLLNVPKEVIILAVEAADCLTVGGSMHPAVQAAVPVVVDWIREFVGTPARVEPSAEY